MYKWVKCKDMISDVSSYLFVCIYLRNKLLTLPIKNIYNRIWRIGNTKSNEGGI